MGAEFTVGNEMAVGAWEALKGAGGGLSRLNGQPVAEVTFPNAELDPVTIYKPYPTYEEAKAAAKAVADEFNRLAPRGFMVLGGRNRPDQIASRAAVEKYAREWAGNDAVVIEVA